MTLSGDDLSVASATAPFEFFSLVGGGNLVVTGAMARVSMLFQSTGEEAEVRLSGLGATLIIEGDVVGGGELAPQLVVEGSGDVTFASSQTDMSLRVAPEASVDFPSSPAALNLVGLVAFVTKGFLNCGGGGEGVENGAGSKGRVAPTALDSRRMAATTITPPSFLPFSLCD